MDLPPADFAVDSTGISMQYLLQAPAAPPSLLTLAAQAPLSQHAVPSLNAGPGRLLCCVFDNLCCVAALLVLSPWPRAVPTVTLNLT